MCVCVRVFQDNQIKTKVTTSDLIAAKKKEFLEMNMKDCELYDHVQDDFKNVSYVIISHTTVAFFFKFKVLVQYTVCIYFISV